MSAESSVTRSRPNRLIQEKSPYLLEHAYNPVNWYPWGREAFEDAKKKDKPIFLSIGYSSCHWCHVFRRESLEDPEIAKILNENFVSIKVDREERPDVDEIYMKAVMSMIGSGGWPLNVFLTPNLEPFYGGTYFPPTPRGGIPGFAQLLKSVSKAWKNDRDKIVGSAKEVTRSLIEMYSPDHDEHGVKDTINYESTFDQCFSELASVYDETYGGFGSAPKFPSPSNIFFLLRYHKKTGQKAPLLMAEKTLENLGRGGIYDHVGGGFHRYSTDREWLVPHFEKMLYDNALLALAYSEAYLITKDRDYEDIVKETLFWVLREMTGNTGGFFSAQDADSTEGEGAFYLWSDADITDALTESFRKRSGSYEMAQRDVKILSEYFGVTMEGNYPETRKSILTTTRERAESLQREYSMVAPQLVSLINEGKVAMREFRKERRAAPSLDDKILVSWNGLMISAMSKAYQVFGVNEFLSAAKRSADFILDKLLTKKNGSNGSGTRLVHRYRDGDSREAGTLEDYAYLTNGLIDLYESAFDSRYLEIAIGLAESAIKLFYDEKDGGFFLTGENEEFLIARPRDAYDGAIPSGNSVISLALLRLGELTMNEDYTAKAKETLQSFWSKIEKHPSAFAFMLVALYFHSSMPREIVISGKRESDGFSQMIETIRSIYLPNSVILLADESVKDISPLAEGRIALDGDQLKVFVCRGNTCKLPSTSRADLMATLSSALLSKKRAPL